MKPQLTFFTIITAPASISSQKLPLKTILNTISSSENPSWVNDDNATLLDIFGEIAKDVITNQMVRVCSVSMERNTCKYNLSPAVSSRTNDDSINAAPFRYQKPKHRVIGIGCICAVNLSAHVHISHFGVIII